MARLGLLFAALAVLVAAGPAPAKEPLNIVRLARSWPAHFALSGTKTEPTYIEHVQMYRDGNVFTLEGGAPAGMTPSVEIVTVAQDGTLTATVCPKAMNCALPLRPDGFLASAAILGALRRGKLKGRLEPRRFGRYWVVCVPAEQLGIAHPILDPCVEIHTGAVLAQRHRRTGRFDGPSLDPSSIRLTTTSLAMQ
jgi:hypothetical protein